MLFFNVPLINIPQNGSPKSMIGIVCTESKTLQLVLGPQTFGVILLMALYTTAAFWYAYSMWSLKLSLKSLQIYIEAKPKVSVGQNLCFL